jgi:hypothetical protein
MPSLVRPCPATLLLARRAPVVSSCVWETKPCVS